MLNSNDISMLFRLKSRNETGADFDKVKRDTKDVQNSATKMGDGFNIASGAVADFFGNIALDVLSTLTTALLEGGKAVLLYSARMEQTTIAFNSLIGNADKAAKHLADLKKFAIDTPFEFEGLVKGSQRLQGANVELEKVIPLMKDIGNIVSATGDTSEERINGIITAISQMIGKTKVSAEEMEQLSERGVQGWDILSEATGKTQAELRKLSEQGALSADVMVKALQKIGREKYGDAMEKQSKTFNGAMSSIKDVLMQTAETAFKPWYDQISKFTAKLAADLTRQTPEAKTIFSKFGESLGESMGQGFIKQFNPKNLSAMIRGVFSEPELIQIFVGMGKGFVQGMRNEANGITPAVAPVVPPEKTPNVEVPNTKELLEKQRKEQEEALNNQLVDLKKYNDLKIQEAQQTLSTMQKDLDDRLELEKISLSDYIAQSLSLIDTYQRSVQKLMEEGQFNNLIPLTGQDRKNAELEFKNALEKFNSEINESKAKIAKLQVETQKKADEEALKNFEANEKRKIAVWKAFYEEKIALEERQFKDALRAGRDKDAEESALRIFNYKQQLRNKEIELLTAIQNKQVEGSEEYKDLVVEIAELQRKNNVETLADLDVLDKRILEIGSRAVETLERIKEEREKLKIAVEGMAAPAPVHSGEADSGGGGFFDNAENLELYGALADSLTQSFSAMADAVGSAVEAFILFGDAGTSFQKFAAQMIASIAKMAAIQAIWNMAEGFAKLALAFFGHPSAGASATQHFIAAGVYAGIAGIAAVSGRAVAGDAFKQQRSGAFGESSERRSGSGGEVYSESRDKQILNMSRNAAATIPEQKVIFQDKTSFGLDNLLAVTYESNGKFRTVIRKDD